MSPSNQVRNSIYVDVKFSQDIYNGVDLESSNYFIIEDRMKHIIGSSTQGHLADGYYEEEWETIGRTYSYRYTDEENTEDDRFSLEYATTFIPIKLEHLKNNPMVEWFNICLQNRVELYRYERTTG